MTPEASPPRWLVLAGGSFVAAILLIVVSSVRREVPPGYPIVPLTPTAEPASLTPERQVTLDARDPDRWTRLDLSRAAVVDDSARGSWDLAARRFRIVVNGGTGFAGDAGVVRVPGRGLEAIAEAPAGGYVQSRISPAGDTINSELEDWYAYGFFSHLLEPRDAAYVVRTADGRYAKLRIVGYYCPGAEPGCLTIRYVYQGDGSRRLIGGSGPAS